MQSELIRAVEGGGEEESVKQREEMEVLELFRDKVGQSLHALTVGLILHQRAINKLIGSTYCLVDESKCPTSFGNRLDETHLAPTHDDTLDSPLVAQARPPPHPHAVQEIALGSSRRAVPAAPCEVYEWDSRRSIRGGR